MIPYLYRFRPVRFLLDEPYEELNKQEIFFARPDELNDPMEGYKDVYWTGDRIVWRNLLRHYLLCLLETASSCLSLGPQFDGAYLKTTFILTPESLPEAPVRSIFQRMCHAFLATQTSANCPRP